MKFKDKLLESTIQYDDLSKFIKFLGFNVEDVPGGLRKKFSELKPYKTIHNLIKHKIPIQAESLDERELTDKEYSKREEIVKAMKSKKKQFQDKYGERWKEVMYATATKQAKNEDISEEYLDEFYNLFEEYLEEKQGSGQHKMKDVVDEIKKNGWSLHRKGTNHDIYKHPKSNKELSVPRHKSNEISSGTAKTIMKQSKTFLSEADNSYAINLIKTLLEKKETKSVMDLIKGRRAYTPQDKSAKKIFKGGTTATGNKMPEVHINPKLKQPESK